MHKSLPKSRSAALSSRTNHTKSIKPRNAKKHSRCSKLSLNRRSPVRLFNTVLPPTPVSLTTPTKRRVLKIKDLADQLEAINSSQPEREVWWIIQAKSGIPETILRQAARFSQPNIAESEIDVGGLLTPVQLAAVNTALDERIQLRRPLQYVLGDVDFCKLTLRTQEGILIPRPETEQMATWLVHQIKLYNQYVLYETETKLKHQPTTTTPDHNAKLNTLQDNHEIETLINTKQLFDFTEDTVGFFHNKYPLHRYKFSWFDAVSDPLSISQRLLEDKQKQLGQVCSPQDHEHRLTQLRRDLEEIRVLDLCSGSGNISLALGSQFPYSKVVGVDIDPNALQLSRFNKRQLNLSNVKFYHCDLFRNSISQTIDPTALQALPTKMDPNDVSSGKSPKTQQPSGTIEDPTMDPKQNPDFLFTTKTLTFDQPKKKPIAALADVNTTQTEQFLGLYDLPILSSLADIIISNPPYVLPQTIATLEPEVKNWENHFALAPFETIYNSPELGIPYKVNPTLLANRGLKPEDLPPWPTAAQIREHALPFYERIIKNSTRLLTHNEHYIPRQGIKFPRLVLEIGHESQALHVANMASYIFDVEVYTDAYDRPRWIVGYEPPGYH